MIEINVKQAVRDFHRTFNHLSQRELNKITVRALNRSITHGRTIVKRETKKVYNFKSEDTKGIKIWRANKNDLRAKINTSNKPISLSHFKPKFQTKEGTISIVRSKGTVTRKLSKTRGKAQGGVSVEIMKGQRQTIPYAFMIRNNDRYKSVFARGKYVSSGGKHSFIPRHHRITDSKDNDLPITKLVTTSYHGATLNKKVQENTEKDLTPYFLKRMQHEMDWLLKKATR